MREDVMRDSRPRVLRSAFLCLCLAALLTAARSASAQSQVLLADGRALERVNIKPGANPNQVVIEPASGEPITVTPEELLVVDFGKTPGQDAVPTVRLVNGDQVHGKVTFPTARTVKVAAGWGSLTVPLRWCSAIRLNDQAALPGSVTKDTLVLSNDRVEGDIDGIANGKVTLNLGGKNVPLELSRVQALALAPKPRGNEPAGGLLLGVDLGGGQRVTGRWVALTPDILTVKTDWGENLDIPVGSISRLEVKNGKLVYVSALRPTEVKYTPYLDAAQPYRVDRAVSGKPMRLAGKLYSRGLGVRSRTDMTYALDGGYQTFTSMVGLDDTVAGAGSVIFRVYGDDKVLFESPILRGGDAPIEVKVPLKGVLLLRLEVDYGDNGDAADHADWADARLLRQ